MAQKRRDSKGRVLLTGETQETSGPNKGRYMYSWTDSNGKRHRIYSWRLTATDRAPAKCRKEQVPLREQEKQIQADANNGIDAYTAKRKTLNTAWDEYLKSRTDLKASTYYNYCKIYDRSVRDVLGSRALKDIKFSDIRNLYISLLGQGVKIGTLHIVQNTLNPVFEIAVRDNLIYTNPCHGAIKEVTKTHKTEENASGKRFALTLEEQTAFLSFVQTSDQYKRYFDFYTIAFGTGMRSGELCALRWDDVDMENDMIHVNHSLLRAIKGGNDFNSCHHVVEPKTPESKRTIPILPEVKQALTRQKERTGFLKDSCIIDGYSGFVFLTSKNHTKDYTLIDHNIQCIVSDYNQMEEVKAAAEHRTPSLIRNFSVHIIRHTFITRLCEKEVNPKTIQAIAGHSDIRITMNIYAEVHDKTKHEALNKIDIGLKMG